MDLLTWLLVALTVLFLLAFPVYALIRWRRSKKRWKELRDQLGLDARSSYRLEGAWGGREMSLRYDPGRRYQRSTTTVELSGSLPEGLTGVLRRERWWDRLAKRSGLVEEIQVADPDFNDRIYVESEDRDLRDILNDSRVGSLVKQLIDNRHVSLRLSPGSLQWKTTNYFGFWKECTPRQVEQRLEQLEQLVDRLSEREPRGTPAPADPPVPVSDPGHSVPGTVLLYTPPIMAMVFGFVLFFLSRYFPTFTSRLQWTGLKIAGVSVLLYLPVLYWQVRGTSRSHKQFMGLVVITLIGFPLFFVGLLQTVNGLFDPSLPTWREARITRLEVSDGDYQVQLSVRHAGTDGEPELEVSESTYRQLHPGQQVFLRVRRGYLHEPWAGRLRLKKQRSRPMRRGLEL